MSFLFGLFFLFCWTGIAGSFGFGGKYKILGVRRGMMGQEGNRRFHCWLAIPQAVRWWCEPQTLNYGLHFYTSLIVFLVASEYLSQLWTTKVDDSKTIHFIKTNILWLFWYLGFNLQLLAKSNKRQGLECMNCLSLFVSSNRYFLTIHGRRQDQLSEALISKKRVAVLGNSHSAAVALAKLGDAWYTRCV